jgi:hypothetical protein
MVGVFNLFERDGLWHSSRTVPVQGEFANRVGSGVSERIKRMELVKLFLLTLRFASIKPFFAPKNVVQ